MQDQKELTFGVVGGIGPLAGADLFFKFVKSTPAKDDSDHFNVILEQQPLREKQIQGRISYSPSRRKMHIYDIIQQLVLRSANCIILSCFISHTFIEELTESINIPILNMMEGLKCYVQDREPKVKNIGILTSDYVKDNKLFEKYFDTPNYNLIYPDPIIQSADLMEAIYGPQGIKAGHLTGGVIEKLEVACEHLVSKGAELIIPGFTEIPVVFDTLQRRKKFNLIDTNQIYADWAIQNYSQAHVPKQYRIGIIGGLGPSATVDLMDKIISNTPAEKDQEHFKMIVEHNPQIPDRTAHLLQNKEDPTIPLYNCAKKLEQREADFIAIPCNTAHAFVDRIQHHLSIPIINMIQEVAIHIAKKHPQAKTIGLLATSGTIQTRIYHQAFEGSDFQLLTPDEKNQELVMEAIYGEMGVKAGLINKESKDKLLQAARYLVQQGARVLILGCTELPLLLQENKQYVIAEKQVVILDPTVVLAKKCVNFVLNEPQID